MATLNAHPGTVVAMLKKAKPGDDVLCEDEDYPEDIRLNPPRGTETNPILLHGNPGKVLFLGTFFFGEPTHIGIEGINFSNPTTQHMVKFTGGDGWWLKQADVFDSKALGTILVQRGIGPGNAVISEINAWGNHGTDPTHDHLFYISGMNLLFDRILGWDNDSGALFKMGAADYDQPSAENVEVRNSTFWDSGESMVIFSGMAKNNLAHHLIVGKSKKRGGFFGNSLVSPTNTVRDCVVWDTADPKVMTWDKGAAKLLDGGGSKYINPMFDKVNAKDGFHPQNSAAQFAGRWAA